MERGCRNFVQRSTKHLTVSAGKVPDFYSKYIALSILLQQLPKLSASFSLFPPYKRQNDRQKQRKNASRLLSLFFRFILRSVPPMICVYHNTLTDDSVRSACCLCALHLLIMVFCPICYIIHGFCITLRQIVNRKQNPKKSTQPRRSCTNLHPPLLCSSYPSDEYRKEFMLKNNKRKSALTYITILAQTSHLAFILLCHSFCLPIYHRKPKAKIAKAYCFC